ncbi:MAG: metallophosphoesterase [Acholeplasmatales bacterium]|nr:metallophosphoesterase [Acholeplasmatales bacterium]
MKKIITLIILPVLTFVIFGLLYTPTLKADTYDFKGIDFSNVNNGIDTGTMIYEVPNTFEAWIKLAVNAPTNSTGTRYGTIVGTYLNGNDTDTSINLEIQVNGLVDLYWKGAHYRFTNFDARNGEWTHIAVVRNKENSTLTLYVNGSVKQILTSKVLPDFLPKNQFWIGRDARKTMYFTGRMHYAGIFSNSRSEDQIKEDMLSYPVYGSEGVLLSELLDYDVVKYPHDKLEYVAPALPKVPNTFEAWIKLPVTLDDHVRGGVIFGNYNWGVGVGYCNFEIYTFGNFRIYWNSGEVQYIFRGVDLRTGEFEHIALVRDESNNTFTFYHNGEEIESITRPSSTVPSLSRYAFGVDWRNWSTSDKFPFLGEIRQVSVYSDPLSSSEISQDLSTNYIVSGTHTEKELLGSWYFENWNVKEEVIKDDSNNNYTARKGSYNYYFQGQELENDFDYELVVVPDTQIMTEFAPGKNLAQMAWIRNNAQEHKIAFVMHMGDLMNNGSQTHADIAALALDELNGYVPYSFVLGNHDYDNMLKYDRVASHFNNAFPLSKFINTPTFGGSYDNKTMDNTYSLFEVVGVKYLVFALEFAPRPSVVQWANRVSYQYPDRRIIMTTHTHVDMDGTVTFHGGESDPSSYGFIKNYSYPYSVGEEVWDNFLKNHNNTVFTFNGHTPTDDILINKRYTQYGNMVNQFLVDGQGVLSLPEDLLFLMRFNETTKMVYCYYYSPARDAYYNFQNQFAFSFEDEFNPTVGAAGVTPGGEVTPPIIPARPIYTPPVDTSNEGLSIKTEYKQASNNLIPVIVIVSVVILGATIVPFIINKKRSKI